jgi:hypothetical protein
MQPQQRKQVPRIPQELCHGASGKSLFLREWGISSTLDQKSLHLTTTKPKKPNSPLDIEQAVCGNNAAVLRTQKDAAEAAKTIHSFAAGAAHQE